MTSNIPMVCKYKVEIVKNENQLIDSPLIFQLKPLTERKEATKKGGVVLPIWPYYELVVNGPNNIHMELKPIQPKPEAKAEGKSPLLRAASVSYTHLTLPTTPYV